jgi:methyl-accepting chemotaxis protein
MVNNETSKAIKAVNESNAPIQTISNEISNSMRKVMDAHNETMSELTYKLGEMIDAMNTSNDVTKKILKKAST